MGRKRTMNRMEFRSPVDEDYEEREEDEEEEDEDSTDEDDDEDDGDEEDEVEVKKPAPKPKRAPARPRKSRAAKVPRLRVVWGVFDNSNKRVATFEFQQKAEAEAHVVELHEKKGETYFVQPVKEEMKVEPEAEA